MKSAITSKRIGVTAAALVLSGLLVGANATAANAYTYNPSLSVSSTALQPGDLLQVKVNDAPETFTVTFNGVTSTSATPTFEAPSKVGTYELALKVSGKVVSEIAITEGTKLTSISISHGAIAEDTAFTVTGKVSPVTEGVQVKLYGEGATGGYKLLNSGTTSSTGAYSITGEFTGTGKHYLQVVTTATAAYTSVSAKSAAFTVVPVSISISHGTITHNKTFAVTGKVSPARQGVTVTLYGEGATGGYKVLNHGTTSSTGAYSITGKFTGTGKHYLKVTTTASGAFASVTAKSTYFNVK